MLDEIRLLSLDERVSYGLLYKHIPELTDLCVPCVREALRDHDKVHQINLLLSEHEIPIMSTELQPDQLEALRTGIRPLNATFQIKLNYSGVMSEEDGQSLTRLFNNGEFTRVGDPTPRPLSTWQLRVPEDQAAELERVHALWNKSRICVLVETHDGMYWVTPDTVHTDTNYQNYVVTESSSARSGNKVVTPITSDINKRYGQWREVLEELVIEKPELGFVHFLLTHFLQPMDIQLLNQSVKQTALLVTYRGIEFRIVGMSSSGMLLLTQRLEQGVVYETTVPFIVVAKEAGTTWRQKESS